LHRDAKHVIKIAMPVHKQTERCLICGSALEYLQLPEARICIYCGKGVRGHVICTTGHFVCDVCHGMDARRMIEQIVLTSQENDPLAIAELMISHPSLPMLGCEHAFIAGGALMVAIKNSPYGKEKITSAVVQEVFERTAKQAVVGYCGLTGVCGIAPALGACISVFLGSRYDSDSEQKIVIDAVIRVLQSLSTLTGPSCCKAYVRAGLREAVSYMGDRFGILLPVREGQIVCRHSEKHPYGCREEKCPYFQKPAKDLFSVTGFVPGTVCIS
jgi:hypothetical protein